VRTLLYIAVNVGISTSISSVMCETKILPRYHLYGNLGANRRDPFISYTS
jgi:hypothetical protein